MLDEKPQLFDKSTEPLQFPDLKIEQSNRSIAIEEEKILDFPQIIERSPNGESQNENIELLIP